MENNIVLSWVDIVVREPKKRCNFGMRGKTDFSFYFFHMRGTCENPNRRGNVREK
jgi:hypothetical protein